ncbi:MAG: hypothetical protein J6R47_02870 [Acholeplasmatales bacterium]|nr:hypothetical protein [Acholeplasmatales bacterium]
MRTYTDTLNWVNDGKRVKTTVYDDFKRFIKTCKKELQSKNGKAICFTLEQVNAIASEFDIVVNRVDDCYEISIKKAI